VSDRLRPIVLLVDSDLDFRRKLTDALEQAGLGTAHSCSVSDATARLDGFAYDALVVDVRLSDGDGLDVLAHARARYPGIRAIVTTALPSVHHAVNALKGGALDYLIKPSQLAEVVAALQRACDTRQSPLPAVDRAGGTIATGAGAVIGGSGLPLAREADQRGTRGGGPTRPHTGARYGRMVGSSAAMDRLFATLDLIAPTQSTVLITGETGTGKELAARTIHESSSRRDGPFVAFNAAAIPDGLAETELFGHVKGAFTGAVYARVGRFESAEGGTLFIDEVSSMSQALQAKLLRALQEREVERVGGGRPVKINTRVIAASNVDLQDAVRDGSFRSDLFYRLNVIRVKLPALRERIEDIPELALHFARECCRRNGMPEKTIAQSTLQALMGFAWPGNVRHLQNAIEHAVAMSGQAIDILPDALPPEVLTPGAADAAAADAAPMVLMQTPDDGINFQSTMSKMERELILRYLEKAGGNKRRAARLLNLSRTTLIDKLHRLGVSETSAA
jgi:DNA-binding NtrC family response regulator